MLEELGVVLPSRRDQIVMSDDEVHEFLQNSKTMALATLSSSGPPHLVAMWFCLVDGYVTFWTFAKSQKAVNLRRDPRATILVESGEEYNNLKGVEVIGECELLDDHEVVLSIGRALFLRYMGDLHSQEELDAFLATAHKRVGFRLIPKAVVSWDHSKLGGVY